MRVLLGVLGSFGDVQPIASIGRALLRRGHEPLVLAPDDFVPALGELGVPASPIGVAGSVDEILRRHPEMVDPFRGTGAVFKHGVEPALLPLYWATRDAIERHRPDIALVHHIALSMPWACDDADVPWAMAAMAPASWMSRHDPNVYPGMPDRDRYRPWLISLGCSVGAAATRALVDPLANRARRALAKGKMRDVLLGRMFDGVANLGLWSPVLRAPAPDDPPSSRIVGFPWLDSEAGMPRDVRAFLDAGEPPVLFSLGTTVSLLAGWVYERAVAACRATGRRGLILTTRPELVPKDRPESVMVAPSAPHASLMPRCAVSVIHGGIGSTAQALRSGRPMVVIPFAHDQLDNARRARLLGVSRTLGRRGMDARALARAIDEAERLPGVSDRGHELRELLAGEDGAGESVRVLESAAGVRRPAAPTLVA